MNAFTKTLAGGFAATLLLAGSAQAATTDRNRDGLPDRWERSHHLSLRLDQARRDQDHDGLDNRGEYRAGFNPHDRDSDDDGIADGRENAGTITSFANGVLTITLAKGGTLTAKVTDATRLKCRTSARAAADDHGGGGHGGHGGDDHGGGGTEPGDDHGGGGTEAGDDHGGGGEAEPGDDHGTHVEPGDDHGNHTTPAPATPTTGATAPAATCALTTGRKVREAELRTRGGEAVWKSVKL
jgi:hypothetical protein